LSALWSSLLVVALAEMGDKTQLIALALAVRFRRPWAVMLGILLATVLNHALAATVGVWVARLLPSGVLAWTLAAGFIAFGIRESSTTIHRLCGIPSLPTSWG
jgi:putative Ca2+/H+ antiporter (TMEM165/GDT1 family)